MRRPPRNCSPEFLDIKLYGSAKQAAAFAGLVPRHRESGSSLRSRPRLSKLGTPRLRKALYFPAITAVRHNPLIKELGAQQMRDGDHRGGHAQARPHRLRGA